MHWDQDIDDYGGTPGIIPIKSPEIMIYTDTLHDGKLKYQDSSTKTKKIEQTNLYLTRWQRGKCRFKLRIILI